MQFETIQEDTQEERDKAREQSAILAATLEQQGIGLVFTPVQFEVVEGTGAL